MPDKNMTTTNVLFCAFPIP